MSRKTDSPGFGQVPGFTYQQHYDIPPPSTSLSFESPTSSASSPCPDKPCIPETTVPQIKTSLKGVENAKKRLRAFSIQKKTSITPSLPKVTGPGTGTTVLIGKLCSTKVAPKPTVPEGEKVPKPPKPGKCETYSDLKKRTLEEIEDMKRKMELIELGIPLGLVLPPSNSEKGMPTKAMPPIKSFLDPDKVDELIREGKKAKAEGKAFKFDYQKLLPGYDNPFQRKPPEKPEEKGAKNIDKSKDRLPKEMDLADRRTESRGPRRFSELSKERDRYKDRGASVSRDKFDEKKAKEDRDKYKGREKDRNKEKPKDRDDRLNQQDTKTDKLGSRERDVRETNVNLNDYLVCDSWSLENETASPKVLTETTAQSTDPVVSTLKQVVAVKEEIEEAVKEPFEKYRDRIKAKKPRPVRVKEEHKYERGVHKYEKLQPVDNSFTYEIDPDDEAMMDTLEEDYAEKFTLPNKTPKISLKKDLDLDSQDSKDTSMDFLSEEFLESVIKEIKQENLSEEDVSQDKALVEYDMSPTKDESQSYGTPESRPKSGSTTPEIKTECSSQRSEYSESGYKSTESGYKSTENDYKSTESCYNSETGYKSTESVRSEDYECVGDIEKEEDDPLDSSMSMVTRDSLETWSFVLKICQPLLFRHDRNKCYRETKTVPRLWFTENPRTCDCVKDRTVVYGELETCKMGLVNRVYGRDQVADYPSTGQRDWYPGQPLCLQESTTLQPAAEWETEDCSQASERPNTHERRTHEDGEVKMLDIEYQRFMAAVYPEVTESKKESRSNTPTKEDTAKKKKRKKRPEGDRVEKKAKKIKISSEGWGLGGNMEEPGKRKTEQLLLLENLDNFLRSKKKVEKEKGKKRKHESGSESSDDDKKVQRKAGSKKPSKSHKSKSAKRRRLEKKYIRKLKSKQKRRVLKARDKLGRLDVDSENEAEKLKKLKKKRQLKQKKKEQKKKKSKSSSSDSTSSSSDSESEEPEKEKKKKKTKKKADEKRSKKKKDKKKRRKQSTSESTQSDDLFDVDILNNIKTEKTADDSDKITDLQDFSPRRQQAQPRPEIINVKELQSNLVTNNLHIKQEIIDTPQEIDETKTEVSESRQSEESKTEVSESRQNDESKTEVSESRQSKESKTEMSESRQNDESKTEVSESRQNDESKTEVSESKASDESKTEISEPFLFEPEKVTPNADEASVDKSEEKNFKEPQEAAKPISTLKQINEESNHSQGSSQESTSSVKEQNYEKDESHLRPSSQNSNYSFHDVMSASQAWKGEGEVEGEGEGGGLDNYEMYERMAMEYQSGVASQASTASEHAEVESGACRIETVVSRGCRGEIKCDWRPGDAVSAPLRPSRWGLKPGDVNIVLTSGGAGDVGRVGRGFPIRSVLEQDRTIPEQDRIYAIESISSRGGDSGGGYDEAYADMYAASDRLQYGDCFTEPAVAPVPSPAPAPASASANEKPASEKRSLDARIEAVLSQSAGDKKAEAEKAAPTNKEGPARPVKRVSFADGYKPGQDSDTEEPPVKKRKKRRVGCAWPCPATHLDHVPLWDALPPPPPPPGSPPPPPCAPPLLLPRPRGLTHPAALDQLILPALRHHLQKFDPSSLPGLMPPDPPPGMLALPRLPM